MIELSLSYCFSHFLTLRSFKCGRLKISFSTVTKTRIGLLFNHRTLLSLRFYCPRAGHESLRRGYGAAPRNESWMKIYPSMAGFVRFFVLQHRSLHSQKSFEG